LRETASFEPSHAKIRRENVGERKRTDRQLPWYIACLLWPFTGAEKRNGIKNLMRGRTRRSPQPRRHPQCIGVNSWGSEWGKLAWGGVGWGR